MENQNNNSRRAMILIVHALIWAAAMLVGSYFFKGQAWSNNLFLWLIAGFIFSNGLLLNAIGRSSPRC